MVCGAGSSWGPLFFDRYAVLGDDVVIADEAVAKVYERSFDFFSKGA